MRQLIIGLLALTWAPAAFAQHNHGAHEHGAAELRVAVDGQTLLVEFASPLANLVGFEHAPRNPQQRDVLAGAEQTLARFDRLFALPAAAACTLQDVHRESPWPQGDGRHGDGHGHGHGAAHADLAVAYRLECEQPQALSAVEVRLFDVFPRIHRLRAETATPRGQGAATLSSWQRMLNL